MATRILTLEEWSAYDAVPWKTWDGAIKEWNGVKRHKVKIPVASGVSSAFMNPGEQRRQAKNLRKEAKKPIIYRQRLSWDEVCTKLPYVFGSSDKKLNPLNVYVCEKFLEIVRKRMERSSLV